ncbi:MAG: PIN domain nuclease [Ideonella sp.]|nr:PIN domain nuclease [Ideonella sp.]MCC7456763.1 PIN domain nuclease [Nitrospira sp.]
MILVDSSVWIDFFRNKPTPQAEWLDANLGREGLVVGDLILAEVLQGFKEDKGFDEARHLLSQLVQVNVGGIDLAIEAARNHRRLRRRGVTVRGTVDVLIATRCLADGLRLLHSDRDFDPFEKHLGLRVVDCARPVDRP